MGKKNKKLKKEVSIGQKRFRLGLKIYAGVLALAILVVCIIVWNKLSKYQDSYDKAKAAGNPDIYAEEFVSGLSYETILEYVKKYGLNVKGEFDYESEHAEYFTELIEKNEATFVRSEKFKSALPVYDIMSGDTRVAVISLKSLGKNDDFGFHKWQLKDLAFDTEIIKYNDVKIVVPGGAKVTYDGNELTAENMVESNVKKDPVKDYALSLGASDYVTESYVVKNNIGTANIKVTDVNGNTISAVEDNNVYDFTVQNNKAFLEEVTPRVYDTMNAYIYNMYNHRTFAEVAAFLEYGSNAYAVVQDVQATIYWGWTPDTVDILSQNIKDCVQYGDRYFACTYEGKIYKFEEGAMESGEEEFNYRLLFHKVDGKWFLNYFVLI